MENICESKNMRRHNENGEEWEDKKKDKNRKRMRRKMQVKKRKYEENENKTDKKGTMKDTDNTENWQ